MGNITNLNSKEELNGYQEWYINNKIYHRGNYINGNRIGYHEIHFNKITRYDIR